MDGTLGLMNAAISVLAVSLLLDGLGWWRRDVVQGAWVTLVLGTAMLATSIVLLPSIPRIGILCLCGFTVVSALTWLHRRHDIEAGLPWSGRIAAVILLALLLVEAAHIEPPARTTPIIQATGKPKTGANGTT
jgi:hypothetical protein